MSVAAVGATEAGAGAAGASGSSGSAAGAAGRGAAKGTAQGATKRLAAGYAGGSAAARKGGGKGKGKGRRGRAEKVLLAEWLLCLVILALSPLAHDEDTDVRKWMRQASALCGVFLLLGLVSAVGPRTGRACGYLGGLITLVLLIDQRSIFTAISKAVRTPGDGADLGEGADDSATGGQGAALGQAVGGAIT